MEDEFIWYAWLTDMFKRIKEMNILRFRPQFRTQLIVKETEKSIGKAGRIIQRCNDSLLAGPFILRKNNQVAAVRKNGGWL
mgnify:CR=1 FL=1